MSRTTIHCKFGNPRVSMEAKRYINLLNNWKRATEEYNTLRCHYDSLCDFLALSTLEINLIRKKRVKKNH